MLWPHMKEEEMNKRALIAMSGGIDSSVAALLMEQDNYDCVGVTMKLFHNEGICLPKAHSCCSLEDIEDARNVAYTLGMPYYVFDFSQRFEELVIANFVSSYQQGVTPNPCIECNRHLKFTQLYQRAKELDCDYVVTGHYATIEYDKLKQRYLLKKARDPKKDQSYVLYSMTQDQLAHTRFPLGGFTKDEARLIATQHQLINAQKAESQDICFVVDGDYVKFIKDYTDLAYPPGLIKDQSGKPVGEHRGIINYTIGQRKGLDLQSNEKQYVTAIDPLTNEITVGSKTDLKSDELVATNCNWIAFENMPDSFRAKGKIRSNHVEQWASITKVAPDRIRVRFDEPQSAITKGQAVVFYDGDIVVGGATIV